MKLVENYNSQELLPQNFEGLNYLTYRGKINIPRKDENLFFWHVP